MSNQKPNLSFELGRKLLHVVCGSTILVFLFFSTHFVSLMVLSFLLILSIIFSFLSKKHRLFGISFLLDHFEREKYINTFPAKGVVYFLLGSLLSILFFDKNIALASIAIMTFGDATASIFGMHFGKTKNPLNVSGKKLLEGFFAGLLFGFLGALIFVPWNLAIVGAIFGLIIEAIELKILDNEVDDNLSVPIVAGAAMLVMKLFF